MRTVWPSIKMIVLLIIYFSMSFPYDLATIIILTITYQYILAFIMGYIKIPNLDQATLISTDLAVANVMPV